VPPPIKQPPEAVYISFSAEINPNTTESLIAAMANCANQGVSRVHLLLSTPGGNVMNGMNLYNVLRGMPFKLITHNVGNVDSIGNAVYLAGEERTPALTQRLCSMASGSALTGRVGSRKRSCENGSIA